MEIDNAKEPLNSMQVSTEPEKLLESCVTSIPDPPQVFMLTDECFDNIFDCLSLDELNNFGQTYKASQRGAGEYFKQNYKGVTTHCGDKCIYITYSQNFDGVRVDSTIEMTLFYPFITNLSYGSSYPHNNIDVLSYI